MDTLDTQQVYDFYTAYAERVSRRPVVAPPGAAVRRARPERRRPSASAAASPARPPSRQPVAPPARPRGVARSRQPEPVGELPSMRLYAYEDRSGDPRFGVSSTAAC